MAPKLKQGNLFSFFNKKPSPTKTAKNLQVSNTNTALASSKEKATVTSPSTLLKSKSLQVNKANSIKERCLAEDLKIGCRLSVFWPDDKEYYKCVITGGGDGSTANRTTFRLLYDDEEKETVDLRTEKFTILSWPEDNNNNNITTQVEKKRKRRVIEEESDDEAATDLGIESDDGSEFIGNENDMDEDDDEEMTWMVTDEESAELNLETKSEKKASKRVKVTEVTPPKSNIVPTSATKQSKTNKFKTPPRAPSKNVFSSFASESRQVSPVQPESRDRNIVSSKPIAPSSKSLSNSSSSGPVPMFVEKVVNPAGSHQHNHLPFLKPENILDAQKNPPSHPEYNPRTLYYSATQIEKVSKSKVSPAQKQWWDIKSQYFDTVLLFKTGKFYEMFHMDADVGVQTLGFVYMKGAVAHSGFPESAYGYMSAKLVSAGYKVARVEQTETPAMLAVRKKRTSGKKPQVVNREVCSVLSQGTRTFCFLDDTRVLSKKGNQTGIGPLLAIREVIDGDNVEYGVTIVDAIRSCVTLGQFADDILRSRMFTLLATFEPSEILIESHASKSLHSLLKTIPSCANIRLEEIKNNEYFPKSTAVDPSIRKRLERGTPVHPWDPSETVNELHRRSYFPRGSKRQSEASSYLRWPAVLKACMDGEASLAISSLGAALFYLQRSLIDDEILTMGNFKAYIPPSSPSVEFEARKEALEKMNSLEDAEKSGITAVPHCNMGKEEMTNHMQLDGTTLANLEILTNQHDGTQNGSLWKKINQTRSPHGSRLLRAWLLRPLFQKSDIDRRVDAVTELVEGGSLNLSMSEARGILSKCPDLERLLSRVHSMGLTSSAKLEEQELSQVSCHPSERAVLYEGDKYTKRKVEDFSRVLQGLKNAGKIMNCFNEVEIQSPLLQKIVKRENEGGCFPSSLEEDLQWFFDNFDCNKAAKGTFEPARGVDPNYDKACDEVVQFEKDLQDYQEDVCQNILRSSQAERAWKYINTKIDSRDKYMIELPVHIKVPSDFYVKGKRGKGAKQVNKYRTPVTEDLVKALEASLERKAEGKARGMQTIFSKFDSRRSVWEAAAQATAMLDALGSLAQVSSMPGFSRAEILDCSPETIPKIDVNEGFHPCVEITHNGGDFIPNDISLGGSNERVLLLSGPNMGGKSTLLRQTCLISILAQIGSYVPASSCFITPVDRIFTRLGASDRILAGQSTFFVELAETAAALRGATRRSLVIMDELGRGTSTFDGTAIAHATVKHLVENNRCLALFATHYHSLLEDWKSEKCVKLGHMECMVDEEEREDDNDCNITFLYKLGEGPCPKSFGINVARLAALPKEVLSLAKTQSVNFERELNNNKDISENESETLREQVREALDRGDLKEVERLWENLSEQE